MLYVLTFGGDPITLDTLPPDEAARARAALDAWSQGRLLASPGT